MDEKLAKIATSIKYAVFNRNLLEQIAVTNHNLLLDGDEVASIQLQKCRDLIKYAYRNCRFYNELYNKSGIDPNTISTFADFGRLPIITKEHIRNNVHSMIARNTEYRVMEEVYTGGTTGTPLKLFRDKRVVDLMNALFLRTIRRWGCDVGTRTVWMWGLPKDLAEKYDFLRQSQLRTFLRNVTWFDVFDMTEERMAQFTNFVRRFRPSLIIGYVSALYEYAKFLDDNGLQVPPPKAICLTAEPSDDVQRKTIEDAFRSKSYSEYGSTEILRIAAECHYRLGLHVHADSRYVEIVNSNGKRAVGGELGQVVVTDLENKVMPLIRYMNGDVASWQKENCSCGISFPLMSAVEGRAYDMIKLSNGRKIYGHLFSRVLFKHPTEVAQFQVRQTSVGDVQIRIVPNIIKNRSEFEAKIISALKDFTGDLVHYSFEVVNKIERERSGKLRYVKCEI
jgi:phenylacetate-CoA ligase